MSKRNCSTQLKLRPRPPCYTISTPSEPIVIEYNTNAVAPRTKFISNTPNDGEIFVKQFTGTDQHGQQYLLFLGERGNVVGPVGSYEVVNFVISKIETPNRVFADVTFSGEVEPIFGRFLPGNHYSLDGSELLVNETPIRKLTLAKHA